VKTLPVRSEKDPQRKLVRYREGDRKVFVSVRMNVALFDVASALGIAVVRSHVPDAAVIANWQLLTVDASVANYTFFEDLCEALEGRGARAHYLGEVHGDRRRDHFFVVDDVGALRQTALAVAAGRPFRVEVEARALAEEAPLLLPLEAAHRLGIATPPRAVQYRFLGAKPGLTALRPALERLGFAYENLDPATMALVMTKASATDEAAFLGLLRTIVPLSRNLGCSYDGAETVDGADQFQLGTPLPPLYGAPS